jgi:hypothetical protein
MAMEYFYCQPFSPAVVLHVVKLIGFKTVFKNFYLQQILST